MDAIAHVLWRQSGVVSRSQLRDLGLGAHDVRRLLRRRELVAMSPGVYVNHTGETTWRQRVWGAVLALWPAALCHKSALPTFAPTQSRSSIIHVAVDRGRSPAAPPGVRLHRMAHLETKVLWTQSPPRVRIEEAVLDVAAEAGDDLTAIAALADVVQARLTTADRIRDALGDRPRFARRSFVDGVLGDIAAGTCSVLEHGYLARVERPHGLPAAERHVRDSTRGPLYRDVEYRAFRTYLELDGRPSHDNPTARDLDLERDLDAATDGRSTMRLGWGQVFGRPCSTAAKVGEVLRARGWCGVIVSCPDCGERPMRYAGATG